MTLLYNYFAQPPALPGFCRAASAEVIRLSAIPPADFEAHAGQALARLEAPIVDFYRAYHQYREDLAAWRATHGQEAAAARSETRRVGQESVRRCRSRWSPDHYKKRNK